MSGYSNALRFSLPEGGLFQLFAGIILVIGISIFSAWISNLNSKHLKYGSEHRKAMHPDVPEQLLRKTPQAGDIVLGAWHNKYVCSSIHTDAHYLIIGGSGSGKSSCLAIPTLLVNQGSTVFAVDIKGELSAKSTKANDLHIRIFNPQRRDAYGYDPFFLLHEASTEQQVFETMQLVAFSLIDLSAAIKDPFWKNSARNMLVGLLMYFYGQGTHDLISITDGILGQPIKATIIDAIANISSGSIAYKSLIQFSDMPDETLSGVFAEVANALVPFSTDYDLRYAFRENPKRLDPRMLEQGYSIYLCIHEEKLSPYCSVLKLIINQTLGEMEKRPEDSQPILFLLDELPRILSAGKLTKLLDAIKTLRSRHVRLVLVTQSLEALMVPYSENEVIDLMSNCNFKIILDSSSSKTSKQVIEWCGKYRELHQSVSHGGKKSTTTTYEDRDILQPSDLMTLIAKKSAVVISPHGFHLVMKVPYYEDPFFQATASSIRQYNQTIQDILPFTIESGETYADQQNKPLD